MTGHRLFIAATAGACVLAAGLGGYFAVSTGYGARTEAASAPTGLQPAAPAAAIGVAEPAPTRVPPAARSLTSAPRLTVSAPVAAPTTEGANTAHVASSHQPNTPVEARIEASTPAPASAAPIETVESRDTSEAVKTMVEIEVPEDAVIGVRLASNVSTETSEIEDRVVARVSRAVTVDGRTVIPEGAELVGHVTGVERGGRIKEQAKIGITFTAIVIDKVRTPIRTEAIYRMGEAPARDAATKIGGGAAIGTVIGGIFGGKKGAAIGGAAGAAGGTAVTMRGDRSIAGFSSGSALTVKLAAPLRLRIES